jgi:hypothetical protein
MTKDALNMKDNQKYSPIRWLTRLSLLVWALALTAWAVTSPEQPKLVNHG